MKMTEKEGDPGALADYRSIVSHQYSVVVKNASATTGKHLSWYSQ